MTMTATRVDAIPAIGHDEGMALAQTEYERLLAVVDQLEERDWALPTDCVGWDVKALLSHVLGSLEANARTREFVRQFRLATKAAKRSGRPMIDEMTDCQVQEHAHLSPAELARSLRETAPKAVRGRRRTPAPIRALKFNPGPPAEGKWRVGYLIDVIFNRDAWMHRVDLCRATGREMVLTPDHDGRIVADVVAEWARAHGRPFTLTLDGPAAGAFVQGEHGDELHLDAVELCRILSGRGAGSGLLTTEVPF